MNHIINIPRNEVVELVQKAVLAAERTPNAVDAIILKRGAERAPFLAFGITTTEYKGKPCACPAELAGLPVTIGTPSGSFAAAFDNLVQTKYGLKRFDFGVLVID